MRINEIISEELDSSFKILKKQCSEFFSESGGLPLFKNLPKQYDDFHRVKVRHRKIDALGEAMNMAFEEKDKRLAQRAIWASGGIQPIHERLEDMLEPFFVFPIDGYRYIYNTEITETLNLANLNPIIEQFGENKGIRTIADILKFSYTPKNLHEGLAKGSEIILYGIPYYYAMRVSSVDIYEDVLTFMDEV